MTLFFVAGFYFASYFASLYSSEFSLPVTTQIIVFVSVIVAIIFRSKIGIHITKFIIISLGSFLGWSSHFSENIHQHEVCANQATIDSSFRLLYLVNAMEVLFSLVKIS